MSKDLIESLRRLNLKEGDLAADRIEQLERELAEAYRREDAAVCSRCGSRLFELKAQAQEPVARLHITETDEWPDIRVEVLNGEYLQPSMSPVSVFVGPKPEAQQPSTEDAKLLQQCRSSVAFDLREMERLILRKGDACNQCDHDEANRLLKLLEAIDARGEG